MIPAYTLGNAIALVVALVGVSALVNGITHALGDDVLFGAVALVVAWWITTIGPLL